MMKNNYTNQVNKIIESNQSNTQKVKEIIGIEFDETNPVEALVFGESTGLAHYEELNQQDEYDFDLEEISKEILAKIKTYLDDNQNDPIYHYKFRLLATYQHIENEDTLKMEYIMLVRETEATTIQEAVKAAEGWHKQLPKTLPIFQHERRECLFVSVKPTYQVVARDGNVEKSISKGTIEFGNARDINTYSNNLTT